MTDIIKTTQLQEPGFGLIYLYDLEYSPGSYAYFYAGVGGDLAEVTFPDEGSVLRTYVALPLTATGFDISSDGVYSRPELIVANIESVFSEQLGGLTFEDLIGRRITRRTTLEKYLDSVTYTNPVEFPKTTFIIDTIKEKNPVTVTFELSAPFDLAGVKLPSRSIIGGACSWKYKGAAKEVLIQNRVGGCPYSVQESAQGGGQDLFNLGSGIGVYVNKDDEYLLPLDEDDFILYVAGSYSKFDRVYIDSTTTRKNEDGTLSPAAVKDFFCCVKATSDSPTSGSTSWEHVRLVNTSAVLNAVTLDGYVDKRYNDYFRDPASLAVPYQVKNLSFDSQNIVAGTIQLGDPIFMENADICGKSLNSCKKRFQMSNKGRPLPFGGYPGVQQRR